MPICEVKLLFKNETEPVVLRDIDLIKNIPLIVRTIEIQNPDWETEDTVIEDVLEITSFKKESAQFIFEYIRTYVLPDNVQEATVEVNYNEAGAKSLDELKEIIELASFLECTDFMQCIGFVIAKKLESMNMEETAAFFGVEYNERGNFFDQADGWIHPPADVFQRNSRY